MSVDLVIEYLSRADAILTPLQGAVAFILALFSDPVVSALSLEGWIDFGVQGAVCTAENCPGSQFTKVATAWANIGYLTHHDVLHFLGTTNFGLWAPLLYACAALAAFVGVAINMPMRSYTWFLIGPALYSFLVGTTTPVQGVHWVVANREQDMTEVWRDAEVGLTNTAAARRKSVMINEKWGPQGLYEVAMPMVFLDELFSATSNLIIEWTGLYNEEGTGSTNSNLAKPVGESEGPWYLLSSLKWGYVENIVSASPRGPDFSDAFTQFMASECGQKLKPGVITANYISATQSRGAKMPESVFRQGNASGVNGVYSPTIRPMEGVDLPTPTGLKNIFREYPVPGESADAQYFANFARYYYDKKPTEKGRDSIVPCTEYLFTLIQYMRFEAGNAYWQLVRSAPPGFKRDEFLKSLFYGWDIRKDKGSAWATPTELNAFVKHLILAYILRNELVYSPDMTSVPQKFAPSSELRDYSDEHVRAVGDKNKGMELYNWAVLMPHLQGLLVYFLIVAYPFVSMVIILPGHWKTFMTWVSFFAWVKLWDVGFAIVMVLEKSVWAMMGNSSNMAALANSIITTVNEVGGIGVAESEGDSVSTTTNLPNLSPIAKVCSLGSRTLDSDSCGEAGEDQKEEMAWKLFDRLLIQSSAADLDLTNGYYIYIMAALYLAVPAITGQLVLGAKAGAAGMIGTAIGGVTGEAGRAGQTGFQAKEADRSMSNKGGFDQMTELGQLRKDGLAAKHFDYANQALDAEAASTWKGFRGQALQASSQGAQLGAQAGSLAWKAGEQFGTQLLSGGLKAGALVGNWKNPQKGIMAGPQMGIMPGVGSSSVSFGEGIPTNAYEPGGAGVGANSASGGAPAAGGAGTAAGNKGTNWWAPTLRKGAENVHKVTGPLVAAMDSFGYSLPSLTSAAVATAVGLDIQGAASRDKLSGAGYGQQSKYAGAMADFNAKEDSWAAKRRYGGHISGRAAVRGGVNPGSFANQRSTELTGLAGRGMLGSDAQSYVNYAGDGFIKNVENEHNTNVKEFGGALVLENWEDHGAAFGGNNWYQGGGTEKHYQGMYERYNK